MSERRPGTSHIAPFGLRMQPELRDKLEQSAAQAGRSLNTEIVQRLEQTLTDETEKRLIEAIVEMQGKLDLLLQANRDKPNVIDLLARLEGRVKRPESAEKGRKRTK